MFRTKSLLIAGDQSQSFLLSGLPALVLAGSGKLGGQSSSPCEWFKDVLINSDEE